MHKKNLMISQSPSTPAHKEWKPKVKDRVEVRGRAGAVRRVFEGAKLTREGADVRSRGEEDEGAVAVGVGRGAGEGEEDGREGLGV